MKVLILSSLTVAIATTLNLQPSEAIANRTPNPQFEQSELISRGYIYRRYTGGTGRREILS